MADGIVGWHFFDAESGLIPDEIGPSILPGAGAGRIVVLAATPFACANGWASRAVVALAGGWAKEDLRIFLMDLGLDSPSLHGVLGLPNLEGVSDAFLYGASVQRIAQPALDEAIFFASAGSASTDPEQILGHPRWNDLAGGFSEADATLLLFLPVTLPGADKILGRATDVLFLAGQGESPEAHLGQASVKVAAMFGPMGSLPEGEEEGAGFSDSDFGPDLSGELDSAGGFAFPDEDGGSPSDLELDGGLRLAEGFSREFREGEPEEGEASEEPPFAEGTVEGLGSRDEAGAIEGSVPSDEAGAIEGLGTEGEIVLEGDSQVFSGFDDVVASPTDIGGDLTLAEGLSLNDGEHSDAGHTPGGDPPDFDPEFASMPGLEGEEKGDPAVAGSQFVGDLTAGSEFSMDHLPQSEAEPGVPDDGVPEPAEESEARGGRTRASASRYSSDGQRPRRRPPPRRRRHLPLFTGVLAILGITVSAVGTAMGVFSVPGFSWLQSRLDEVPYPELTPQGPEAIDPVLRFSLELDVYEEDQLGLAIEMRNTLRGREQLAGLLFNLTPVESDGVVSYRLHAGPAQDVVQAENLRGPLEETLIREDPEAWAIQATPRAFFMGRRETLEDARAHMASLEDSGIPSYILQVTRADGSEGFEILSGAFEGVEDARWWQLALRAAGFADVPLIERRGRPPE